MQGGIRVIRWSEPGHATEWRSSIGNRPHRVDDADQHEAHRDRGIRHDGRVAARAEEDEFTVFVHDRLSEFWRSRRLEASLGSSSLEIRSAID